MNDAYLHLIVNHVPIFSMLFGLFILAWGLFKKKESIQHIAMALFILGAVSAYTAVETGERAEEVVEDRVTGVSHDLIHNHEEAAEIAMWLSIITGVLALASLFVSSYKLRFKNALVGVVLVAALASAAALLYTAYEGGKIRHPEAHDTAQVQESYDDD